MSTTTEANVATVQPIVSSAPAPVAEAIIPTPEAWRAYLDAIVDGAPTGKILPAPLGKLTLTDAQRQELKDARRDNAVFAQANRKLIHRLTSRKCFTAGGVKFAKSASVSMRFVPTDKKAATRAITEFRAKMANA